MTQQQRNAPKAAQAFDLDGILGTSSTDDTTTAASAGAYLTTDEKNALYAAKTPLHIHAVGERVSFRWQKPEWVLVVTTGDDATERRLTFEKGGTGNTSARDSQISRIQLHLKSPASRDAAGHAIPLTVVLTRDESKRARPWLFGKT